MTKKKNYFFVVTGLQVINSVEYIHYHQKHNELNILVVCNRASTARFEVNSSIKIYNWDKIIYLPTTNILKIRYNWLRFFLSIFYSFFRLKFINFDNATIIGNDITAYFRYMSKNKKISKIVFIDDGNGTINYTNDNPYRVFKNFKSKFTYKFLNIDKHKIEPHVFFTSYPESIGSMDSKTIIKNEFSYIKSLKSKEKRIDKYYFVGDPHVERGYLSREEYLNVLIKINIHFNNKLVYMPRLFENKSKVQEISQHLEVQYNDVPFELFLATIETKPRALIAFHSTVLFNVNKMFGNSIDYYYTKLPNYTNDEHMKNLETIWNELDEFAIELKLNNNL